MADSEGRGALRFPPLVGEPEGDRSTWQALLLLHIPKTAGITLHHVLNRQYGVENVLPARRFTEDDVRHFMSYLEGDDAPRVPQAPDPNDRTAPEVTSRSSEELRRYRAVVGHFWYGLHERFDRPTTYMTVVREPVERVLSTYYFYRARFGLSLGLEEYVTSGRDFDLQNGQTRRLCGPLPHIDVRHSECTSEMLERAKTNLRERFSVVGVTERFHETFLLMARTFGWRRAWFEDRNVNRERPPSRDVPASIRDAIVERNRFDTELHAHAASLLDERLADLDPPVTEKALRTVRRRGSIHSFVRRNPAARRLARVLRPIPRAR